MKMELLALQEGGSGARPRVQIEHETCWNMTTTNKFEGGFDDEESSWSSDSEEDVSSVESSDFGVPEEEEESCLTDLVGNRILPVGQVVKAFRQNVCCRKCAVKNHKSHISAFLTFCKEYDEKREREEQIKMFHSRTQRLEWRLEHMRTTSELYQMFNGGRKGSVEDNISCEMHVAEETWGVATTLYGRCKRKNKPHHFTVNALEISDGPVKQKLHQNSKTAKYSINHQLCAAMQQMGCGPSDVKMLTGFMDLPSSARIDKHMAVVEKALGSVQEEMREASQKDALEAEVALAKAQNDLAYHKCTVIGHEHGPMPMVKGSYGERS